MSYVTMPKDWAPMTRQALLDSLMFASGYVSSRNPALAKALQQAAFELSTAVQAKCSECGCTSTPDSMWALYCVGCIKTKVGPALQGEAA